MKAKVNYSEWKDKFGLQCKLILKYSDEVVLKAAEVLFDRIVERTPVGNPALWNPPYYPRDYAPGTLRDSWEFIEDGKDIVIQNLQPYAYRVEYGWSTQAPRGMMRISIKEFGQILRQVSTKRI